MESTKFSIIVPCYNSAEFVPRCLDSILNTKYKNLEIICINDGSKDNTLEILDKYASKDSRIKVINQQNKGIGATRNVGLENACGDFIHFVDSDDTVEEQIYDELNKFIIKHNPNVVHFGANTYLNGKLISRKSTDERLFYTYKDYKNFIKDCRGACWDKACSLKFLKQNNIDFICSNSGEDTHFTRAVVLLSPCVHLLHKNLYNYIIRPNSTMCVNTKLHNTFYVFEQTDYTQRLLKQKFQGKELEKYNKQYNKYKMRLYYLGDKKCLPELKKQYLQNCKKRLTSFEYLYFILHKNISYILRNLFSVRRNVEGTSAWGVILLGKYFKISIK